MKTDPRRPTIIRGPRDPMLTPTMAPTNPAATSRAETWINALMMPQDGSAFVVFRIVELTQRRGSVIARMTKRGKRMPATQLN